MPIEIKGHIDDGGLAKWLERAPGDVRHNAGQEVLKVSFLGERLIKGDMPVDTGRARASWGHWTPGDLLRGSEETGPKDAVWKVEDGGMTVVQGTNVTYVAALNEGSSMQSPAGFIDRIVRIMARELEDQLVKLFWRSLFGRR